MSDAQTPSPSPAPPVVASPTTLGEAFPMFVEWLGTATDFEFLAEAMQPDAWRYVLPQLIIEAERHFPGASILRLTPALQVWALQPIQSSLLEDLHLTPLKQRTQNVLGQNGIKTWGDLLTCSPLTIGDFQNSGATTVRDVLRAAIELGAIAALGARAELIDAASTREETSAWELLKSPFEMSIQNLARWALQETGSLTIGEAIDSVSDGLSPPDIAMILTDIRSSPLEAHALPFDPSAMVLSTVLGELGEFDQRVILKRILCEAPPTLEELGREIGVTRERVRQIQVRAEERFRTILGTEACRPIAWRAHSLRNTLGSCAPMSHPLVIEALGHAVRGEQEHSDAFRVLLLQEGGPFNVENGFLTTFRLKELAKSLEEIADEFGVIDLSEALALMSARGIRKEFIEAIIQQSGHFRLWDQSLLVWSGSGVEKAVTMLSLRGSPATIEEIIEDIGENYSDRSLQSRISEDPRVTRVNRHQFALREWGYEEYSTIAEAISAQIEKDGGESIVNDVVAQVSAGFHVRPSSVRMYAEAPMFLIHDGRVRLRNVGEGLVISHDISPCQGVYALGPDQIAYLMEVDGEVLRGSGHSIPQALATRLGVSPGMKFSYSGDYGEIVLSWPSTSATGPSIGSTRRYALGAGCETGSRMRLTFNVPDRKVSVHPVTFEKAFLLPSAAATLEITGIRAATGDEEIALASAIGVQRTELRRALINRGDEFLLPLLPEQSVPTDLGAALDELVKALDGG